MPRIPFVPLVRSVLASVLACQAFAAGDLPPASRVAPCATHGGFVENLGQLDEPVRFMARHGGVTAWLTEAGVTLAVLRDADGTGCHLALDFEDAEPDVTLAGVGAPIGVANSYIGRDRSRWVEGARAYPAVRFAGVRPGVDMLMREGATGFEYDLALAPGADLSGVVLRLSGADELLLSDEGRTLIARTAAGELVQSIPASWQPRADGGRRPLDVRFVLLGRGRFGFSAPERDARAPLVVDPALTYGSFMGGSIWDRARAVVYAGDGQAVISGFTTSTTFPTTVGAFQGVLKGSSDAFICRLDLANGGIVYSTLLGGTDSSFLVQEVASALALAPDGSVYATGTANCFDFPTTVGAFKQTNSGGTDAWAAKLGPNGALHWCTILGGGKNDFGTGIALAADGVVVVGHTFSDGASSTLKYPTTVGAYDRTFNSIFFTNDGFVTKVALTGASLVWSTLLGGVLRDEPMAVALAPGGDVLVTGLTGSVDFPVTPGAFDESFNGPSATETDAFVTRVAAAGNALIWSSYLGGASIVESHAIALDASEAAVIGGTTRGADLPATPGALAETYRGGLSDGFVARFLPAGNDLAWLTYLGGNQVEEVNAVMVDTFGLVTAAGTTESPDFPLTPDAYDASRGSGEAFVARLAGTGDGMVYASFFGGSDEEECFGLALDEHGAVILVGQSDSPDMNTTPGAVDVTYNSGGDAFIARLQVPPWADIGFALAGTGGIKPELVGAGTLEVGSPGTLTLSNAAPSAPCFLFGGVFAASLPFHGGTLVPFPAALVLQLGTLPDGSLPLGWAAWPAGIPPGFSLYMQVWIADAGAIAGASASNAVRGTQP